MKKKRTALVLSGGGSKGAFEAGAISILLQHFTPDLIIATSVGAINGALIAGGTPPKKIEEYWKTTDFSKVFPKNVDVLTILESKLLGNQDALQDILQHALPVRKFEQCTIPLLINAHTTSSKEDVLFTSGTLIPAIMASCAIFPFLPKTKIGQEQYIDSLHLPPLIEAQERFKFERAIIIDLYPKHLNKQNFRDFIISCIELQGEKSLKLEERLLKKNHVELIHIDCDIQVPLFDFSKNEELIEHGKVKAKEVLHHFD